MYQKLLISQGAKMELYALCSSEFPVIEDV